jgi:two-component system, cell cycle response regulator
MLKLSTKTILLAHGILFTIVQGRGQCTPFCGSPMKVLVADDEPNARSLLCAIVTRLGYKVEAVSDGMEAWRALERSDSPQIAILDWMMPGMSGPEICRKVRQRGNLPYVYIILITGLSTIDHRVAGMEAGADDYIAKPFRSEQLRACLSAAQRILDLQQELLTAQRMLEIRATHDGLTGVWNHAAILERLTEELNRAEREMAPVGVILLDLDHFKRINDTYGHLVGDQVLKESARRMGLTVRSYDMVGRYGGDEFLIVAPGCDGHATLQLAERVCNEVAATPIIVPNGYIAVRVSAGATVATMGNKINCGLIVNAADRALYTAKEAGRNQVKWLIPE